MAEQPSKSVQSIYTFEDVYFSVDNRKSPVSAGTLHLVENAIPTLLLTIDPKHQLNDPTNEATSPQLGTIAEWHKYYMDLAFKRTPCTFNAKILRLGKVEQTLTLTDWILTGAGITSVAATGSLALELEMQHPMCLCQDSVLSIPYVPYTYTFQVDDMSSYNDIVGALAGITLRYSLLTVAPNVKTVPAGACGSGVGSIRDQDAIIFLQKQMAAASSAFSSNLEWDTEFVKANGYNNWPFQNCLAAYLNAVKYSLVDCFSMGATNNLWELLIQRVTSDWKVSVMPVLKGKLKLRPFSPWLKPTMKVYDEDIPTLNFPGEDPAPVVGVTVADIQLANTTSYFPYRAQQMSRAGVTFAPVLITKNPGIYRGSIAQFKIPGWLSSAQNRQSGLNTSNTNGFIREQDGELTTEANIKAGDLAPGFTAGQSTDTNESLWSGASLAYAQSCFYSLFRQQVQVGVRTRLMIESPNGVTVGGSQLMLPCNVCSVISTPNQVVFDFYVTSVIHSFDCERGQAGTVLAGTYARPSESFPGIVDPGTLNTLYKG